MSRGQRKKKVHKNRWSAKAFRIGATDGPASIQFQFPTTDGNVKTISYKMEMLRRPRELLSSLSNYLPKFPDNAGPSDRDQIKFLRKLAKRAQKNIEIVPEKTGFMGTEAFATHCSLVRKDSITPLNWKPFDGTIVCDKRGTLQQSLKDVAETALHSTYLAFALGVALAGPLQAYARSLGTKKGTSEISETCIFNFSGTSSSGKTSLAKAALSLSGSPERAGHFSFTQRGLAEVAYENNELLLVFDDTEKNDDLGSNIVRALKAVVHTIPGGQSKIISRGVDQTRFPQLTWSTFVISTSPQSIQALADHHGWKLSRGDQVRLFDIRVPGPDRGGIFDLGGGSKSERRERGLKLIRRLEHGYRNNFGQIIEPWTQFLLSGPHSSLIAKLQNKFVSKVLSDSNGWEVRFAQKFGVIYAAMVLAIKAELLPWPEGFPFKVASKCYRKARRAAKTEEERNTDARAQLCKMINRHSFVDEQESKDYPITINDEIGLRYHGADGKLKIGLLDTALVSLMGKSKKPFLGRLSASGILDPGHGGAGTVQLRIPIEHKGEVISRPRVWAVDVERLSSRKSVPA